MEQHTYYDPSLFHIAELAQTQLYYNNRDPHK